MKKCWYTVALVYSLGAAVLMDATPGLMKDVLAMQGEDDRAPENTIGENVVLPELPAATDSVAAALSGTEAGAELAVGTELVADAQPGANDENTADGKNAADADLKAASIQTATSSDAPQALMPATPIDFSGALFIGDSRTVGLSEYGDLGEAEVFANTGMSVFNLFASEASLKDGSKTTLEQVLAGNRYQTIYLMLGINELGYKNYEIVERYKTVVDKIKEMQPDAILVLEANLHVTEEKSAQSPIYNNQNINALNQEIEQIAKSRGCFYIDVNEIFDDDSGNLDAGFSSDGSHVYGKYYSVWGEWLRGIAETDG